MLVGENAHLPWIAFICEAMQFLVNLGLEADVKGQLKKMMKHYRVFLNGLCGKYMLGVK